MRIGAAICTTAIIHLIYIYSGGIANNDYFTGFFIGGVLAWFVEYLIGKFVKQKEE